MPRFVRPSFVRLQVDGIKNNIATGPKSKDGEFFMEILVRNNGRVDKALNIYTHIDSYNHQRLIIEDKTGTEIFCYETDL